MVPPMSSRGLLVPFLAASLLAATACDKGGGDPAKVSALEARVAKLEADAKKYGPMLSQIKTNFDRQAAQQEEEEGNEPAEDAVFAVDITGNQIEGPASGAYVTIIEAWDFA
jgi:hypothetical protein